STVRDPSYTGLITTIWYRATELLLLDPEKGYGFPADVWSLMCTLYEICNIQPLFGENCEEDQIHAIFSLLGTPTEEEWPGIEKNEEYDMYISGRIKKYKKYHFIPKIDAIIGVGLIPNLNKRPKISELVD